MNYASLRGLVFLPNLKFVVGDFGRFDEVGTFEKLAVLVGVDDELVDVNGDYKATRNCHKRNNADGRGYEGDEFC